MARKFCPGGCNLERDLSCFRKQGKGLRKICKFCEDDARRGNNKFIDEWLKKSRICFQSHVYSLRHWLKDPDHGPGFILREKYLWVIPNMAKRFEEEYLLGCRFFERPYLDSKDLFDDSHVSRIREAHRWREFVSKPLDAVGGSEQFDLF